MWLDYFVGLVFTVFILFLPGALQCKALGFKTIFAITFSPLIAIFEYIVLGVIFDFCNLAVSGWLIVGIVLVSSIIALFAKRKKSNKVSPFNLSWKNLVLYLLVGIVVTGFHYVQCLNGPDSFEQIYDNAFHLNLIKTYIESGNFSIFNATLNPNSASEITFYPAAWHALAALCGSCCHLSAPIAENVVNTIFLGLVYPSSFLLFLSAIFHNHPKAIPFGSVIVLGFCAFPWSFLTFGPLYSNFAGFCLLPATLAILVSSFFSTTKRSLTISLIIFIVGGIDCAVCQPNAIFTGIILLSPFVVYSVCLKLINHGLSKTQAILTAIGVSLLIFLLWILAWLSPFMKDVISYHWDSFASAYGAITNILSLSLRESPNQYLLGILVIIGAISVIRHKTLRWIVVSYILACIIYFVDATSEGIFKSLFSGFWYNDPYRTAAMVALAAIPLATYGLFSICSLVVLLIKKLFSQIQRALPQKATQGFIAILVVLITLEIYSTDLLNIKEQETAFQKIDARLEWLSDPSTQKLTEEERAFINKCQEFIDPNSTIINFPYDGSVFAYGSDNLNVLWRNFNCTSNNPNSNAYVIQNSLNEISTNSTVADAVKDINAKYILLLDANYPKEGTLNIDIYEEVKGKWSGLLSIAEAPKGFELILSEGDMRLYKIESI